MTLILIALYLYLAGFAIILDLETEYMDHKPLMLIIALCWPALPFVMAWEIYKQRNPE